MTELRSLAHGRRDRSLLTRIGSIILVTAAAVGVVAVAVSANVVEHQQFSALTRRAELVAAMQTDALANPIWEIDDRAVRNIIDSLRERDPAILAVSVFEPGRSEPMAVSGDPRNSADSTVIEKVIDLRGRDGVTRQVGTLRLLYSTEEIHRNTLEALLPVVGLLLLSLVTAIVIISVMLNRVVLGPLRRLTQAAQAVSRGDYGARLATEREDEIGVLTKTFNRMAETVQDYTQTLESRVQERTEALADINRRIMDSINYAQLIQSSILPKPEVMEGGLAEHFVLWRPRDVVSGDFYYYREVEDGFLIGVADCTGHGVPGAFMTMTASAVLNNVVDSMGAADPAALLAMVDGKVRAALHQDGDAASWEGGFDNGLDLALCHVQPAQGRLVYAGARLPLTVAGAEGGLTEIRADRRSLGYRSAGPTPDFTNHSLELRSGQTFYICTDGLTDQCGGERGRSFGKRRLHGVVEECSALPLDRQKERIESSLSGFQGDRPQRDDITMVGFRVRLAGTPAAPSRTTLWEIA
ncbi:SpoIIE family protein phosphatase [Azospirillum isscasi]|uniref:SpoIIE family protein phosphatase n=1 Tax=Azospirillum isscasi TaxID=3053926 RepID=A0ABU0WMU7_9PROT|nr:SpoIIE family protein phosphatase [Azospirillum isscasi]MDQ2105561.1 SpoIIE family protein phosphatase [Azospirillum isscasi]